MAISYERGIPVVAFTQHRRRSATRVLSYMGGFRREGAARLLEIHGLVSPLLHRGTSLIRKRNPPWDHHWALCIGLL